MSYALTKWFGSSRHVLVAVAAAGALAMPELTAAQAAQEQPPQGGPPAAAPEQTVTSADVTDAELEQFAKSIEDVVEIQEETEKRLEGVNDSAEVQRLKTEANAKMAEAIKGHGLEVERYNLIARSIGIDATLKARLQEKMQDLRQPA